MLFEQKLVVEMLLEQKLVVQMLELNSTEQRWYNRRYYNKSQ